MRLDTISEPERWRKVCSISLRGLRPFSPFTYLGLRMNLVHQSSPLVNHPYIYPSTGPLTGNTIRLLEIQPGTPPEPLRCRLVEASLSAVPNYSAISYEWGTSEVYVTIILNDKPFGIRPNLWTFVIHLQDSDTPKVLWVDAASLSASMRYSNTKD